jgi:hypothetical protein
VGQSGSRRAACAPAKNALRDRRKRLFDGLTKEEILTRASRGTGRVQPLWLGHWRLAKAPSSDQAMNRGSLDAVTRLPRRDDWLSGRR